ncbi:MAG: HEAT repeat domain-containing protein [Gemmataceae bacterium]|nr:HEAT repeat domain-containing protein [Gemmataceae bacterium]
MIRCLCPHCQVVIKAGDAQAGTTQTCPKCRKPFQVPSVLPTLAVAPPRPDIGAWVARLARTQPWALAGAGVGLLVLCGGGLVVLALVADRSRTRTTESRPPNVAGPGTPLPDIPRTPDLISPIPEPGDALLSSVLGRLRSPSLAERYQAVLDVDKLGPRARETVPLLIEAVRDQTDAANSPKLRQAAARALGSIGPLADNAVPALLDVALRDPERAVRLGAVEALGKIGRPAVAALAEALRSEDKGVRREAARGLGNLRAEAAYAVPSLVAALQDREADIRVHVAAALVKVDPSQPMIVSVLVEALKNTDAEVRFHAVNTLGDLGERARTALPDLDDRAKLDMDLNVRSAAERAIRRITGAVGFEK